MATSSKKNILLTYRDIWNIDESLPLYKTLSPKVNFIKYKITTKHDFKRFLENSTINGWWINEEFFDLLGNPSDYWNQYPESLKAILVPWVGCEFIDGAKLWKEKQILLCNIGNNAATNVADMAIFLTISCFRLTTAWEYCLRFLEHGDIKNCKTYIGGSDKPQLTMWTRDSDAEHVSIQMPSKVNYSSSDKQVFNMHNNYTILGKELESPTNKNVLILGFGAIGRNIGKRLHYCFDAHIYYFKRSGAVHPSSLNYPAHYCPSLTDRTTWENIDLIVLSLPSNKDSNDLICTKTLAMCKNGVRIVNVGRGSCINEEDLIDALNTGKVSSCGLDVYKDESKPIKKELLERIDITLMPHIGSDVKDMIERQTVATLENIEDIFLHNGKGKYTINLPK
ncbi:hypothetical protein TPHA_0A01160 [Tetrapisispora phaffii CBS 4417]|uniref:D-isomer specific 2-hydroxyacid dehydrogenase NAD-binding domain-containing protein n=1 Tax=Tetrapisispora phaffii (strain ATCC 24235 / CBS 4417 / NBRC 1672 / NRRL Y-8282 / UCD 70-5) TaxID=1071381 RepID=G8BMS2_TETPH|nr:hypothetical protein TPHA_0A01160 [Tetrapisispora phaffii CBS 4417]CCE61200.1 hypothetical protein TPHA_0A01160 [Tetrapisispora phaffii CBS 4417]